MLLTHEDKNSLPPHLLTLVYYTPFRRKEVKRKTERKERRREQSIGEERRGEEATLEERRVRE